MARYSELANEPHVEWRAQRQRDLAGDRDSAARQSEYQEVASTSIGGQTDCELPSRIDAIFE
jgi:hypothetical protein